MEFVELATFIRTKEGLLTEDDLLDLQLALALRPQAGAVVPGTRGLRKLRWAAPGRSKRGGIRVIYFWETAAHKIYLIVAYAKNRRDNLSPREFKQLRKLLED